MGLPFACAGCCSSAWLKVIMGGAAGAAVASLSADAAGGAAGPGAGVAAAAGGGAAGAMGAAGPTGLLLVGEESMAGGMEVRPASGEGTSRVVEEIMAAICMGWKKGRAGWHLRSAGRSAPTAAPARSELQGRASV